MTQKHTTDTDHRPADELERTLDDYDEETSEREDYTDQAEEESLETFHDTLDSYIYGDSEATEEDTIETMTVYDPDADRLEDIEHSGDNELIVCHAYSRKTGEMTDKLAIHEVSKTLTNTLSLIHI